MAEDQGGYRQINKSLNICVFEEYLRGQNANLPKLENVEQVSPRVLRVLGQNPGKVSFEYMFQARTSIKLTPLRSLPCRAQTRSSLVRVSKDYSSTPPVVSRNGLH